MIEMRFEVNLQNPFASLLAASLVQQLREVQERWVRRLQSIVVRYPSQLPGQVYVRTYVFRDNWQIILPRFQGGDLVTELRNATPYAPLVVGDNLGNLQNQVYHAGRWYLFRVEVERSEAQARREAQDAINRVLAPARITP